MSADTRAVRRSLAAAVATAALASGLAACSNSDDGPGNDTAPLPTAAPGDSDLLCNIVPRDSVAAALGRDPGDLETNNGDVTELTEDPITGHLNGRCRIRSDTRSEPALTVVVQWPSTEDQSVVRSRVAGADYTFPRDFAEGYASRSPGGGATAQVIWDDYVVTVADDEPARGRNALEDSVALVHQVIDAIGLTPTPPAGAGTASP